MNRRNESSTLLHGTSFLLAVRVARVFSHISEHIRLTHHLYGLNRVHATVKLARGWDLKVGRGVDPCVERRKGDLWRTERFVGSESCLVLETTREIAWSD